MEIDGELDLDSIYYLVSRYTEGLHNYLKFNLIIRSDHFPKLPEIESYTSIMLGSDRNSQIDNVSKIVKVDYIISRTWPTNLQKSFDIINQYIQYDWEGYDSSLDRMTYGILRKVDKDYLCDKLILQICEHDIEHEITVDRQYEKLLDDLSCPYIVIDLPQTDVNFQDMLKQAKHNSLAFYVTNGGILNICKIDFTRLMKILQQMKGSIQQSFTIDIILTYSTLGISTISLTLFIVITMTDKTVLTTKRKNILALVLSLLITQITFMIGIGFTEYEVLCQIIGVAVHLMWNNVFSWMVLCAFDIWRTFRFDGMTHIKHNCAFTKNIGLSIAIPVCIVSPMAAVHFLGIDAANIHYGGSICFLSTFQGLLIGMYIPVGLMLLVTISSFLHFVLFVKRHASQTSAFVKNRNYLFIYVKLCTLFGFGWSFGLLANLFQSVPLWYAFYILTGLQGLFMTIVFVTKSKLLSFANSIKSLSVFNGNGES